VSFARTLSQFTSLGTTARVSGAALLLYLLLAGSVVARCFDGNAFNRDVAWILYCAGRMLDGGHLYADLIDENPPWIFWLSVAPVALARALGCRPILVYNLFVLGLVALSVGWCQRLLRLGWPSAPRSYRMAVCALLATAFVLLPGDEFGQRENLLIILVMPYLFSAAARIAGTPRSRVEGIGLGLLAAAGLVLKPYYLLLWLCVEGYLLLARPGAGSWKRAENGAIAAAVLGYAACVLLWAPRYFEVAHMALQVYDAYGISGSPALLLVNAATGRVLIASLLCALVRPTPLDRQLRAVLLVAALALLAVALLQGKGWEYHYGAADAAASLLIVLVPLGLTARPEDLRPLLRVRASALPALALLLALAWAVPRFAGALQQAWGEDGKRHTVVGELTKLVKRQGWPQPILALSTSVDPAFPVVNLSGVQWSSRFCCMWLLPGCYSAEERAANPFPYHSLEAMGPIERYALDAVVEDMESLPPELIIVDRSRDKQGFGTGSFDFLRYFLRDPRFAALFEHYSKLKDIGGFRVYKRDFRGGPSAAPPHDAVRSGGAVNER
jgi:hypothetical protein